MSHPCVRAARPNACRSGPAYAGCADSSGLLGLQVLILGVEPDERSTCADCARRLLDPLQRSRHGWTKHPRPRNRNPLKMYLQARVNCPLDGSAVGLDPMLPDPFSRCRQERRNAPPAARMP